MRKCKEIGEVAVMEAAEAASRTAFVPEAVERAGRKRKVVGCAGELDYSASLYQMRSHRRITVNLEYNKEKADSSRNDPCASCCSSDGSCDLTKGTAKLIDLEEEQEESIEISTSTYEYEMCRKRREITPSSSEAEAESDELESTAKQARDVNSRRRLIEDKMPSKAELEDFFSAAENEIQKQFIEKYNFNFTTEEPLDGRYEWVRTKP